MSSNLFRCYLVLFSASVSFAGCGYCKKLKPDFALAATELKGEAVSPNNIIYRS